MTKKPKKCPKCGRYSLDWNHIYKVWKCVWVECVYIEENDNKV